MKFFFQKIRFICLSIFLGIAGCLFFLLATHTGLCVLVNLTKPLIPGNLSFKTLNGYLLGNISVEQLHYKNADLDIQVKSFVLNWTPSSLLHQQLDIQSLDLNEITLQNISGNIHLSGTLGKINRYHGDIKASLTAIPSNPHDIQGKITLDGKLQSAKKKISFMTKITGSNLRYQKNPIPQQVINLNLQWQKNKLYAKSIWIIDKTKNFEGECTIHPFNVISLDAKHLERQHLSGNLFFSINRLDFLNRESSPVKKVQGTFHAKAKLSGTLAKPFWDGTVELKAQGNIPQIGLNLNHVDLALKANPQNIHLAGKIVSGNKTLSLMGESEAPFTKMFKAKLNGQDFPFMNTNEYQIHVTPDIHIQWTPDKITIHGNIDIPFARIEPMEFTGTLELPTDVEFVSDNQEEVPIMLVDSQVNVRLGKDVQLKTHGLSGTLIGSVLVIDQNNEPTKGEGSINIIDGQYDGYGEKLKIDKALATFSHSPIDNPQLFVRATRSFATTTTSSPITNTTINKTNTNNTNTDEYENAIQSQFDRITVGIEITGYLKNPTLRLFSIPATLSQADILSFLVLGRPMSQASSADGALLVSALSSMNVGNVENNQIMQQLQHTFGLDIFNIETNSQYDPSQNKMLSSTSLVIGKMISPKLFVNYSIGLLSGSNILKVKYFLTPQWILQTETDGANEGVDIFYSFTRN